MERRSWEGEIAAHPAPTLRDDFPSHGLTKPVLALLWCYELGCRARISPVDV